MPHSECHERRMVLKCTGSADFNNDGAVQVEDLTQFLQAYSLGSALLGRCDLDWLRMRCGSIDGRRAPRFGVEQQSAGPWNPACGVPGCSFFGALNFEINAGQDNGVCLFAGCTDVEANYDRLANVDDNTCRYDVCLTSTAMVKSKSNDLMDFLLLWGE